MEDSSPRPQDYPSSQRQTFTDRAPQVSLYLPGSWSIFTLLINWNFYIFPEFCVLATTLFVLPKLGINVLLLFLTSYVFSEVLCQFCIWKFWIFYFSLLSYFMTSQFWAIFHILGPWFKEGSYIFCSSSDFQLFVSLSLHRTSLSQSYFSLCSTLW